VIANGTGVGTIVDNDPAPPGSPALSIADASVTEADTGTRTRGFTVTLAAASANTVFVDWATSNGTATAGSDYVAGTGTLTFTPGGTTRNAVVTTTGDTADERNETFTVTLSAPVNATVGDGQAVGTINDNDPAPPGSPTVAIADATVVEADTGTKNRTFAVTLSAASANTVYVSYATADGTATAGSDYTAVAGTLTFAPGTTSRNVVVVTLGDTVAEPDETLTVNLSAPVNATFGDNQATGTIQDNDP
jgi:chitinase